MLLINISPLNLHTLLASLDPLVKGRGVGVFGGDAARTISLCTDSVGIHLSAD